MKTQSKWLLAGLATAALAACGGGSSDTTETTTSTPASLAEVKYATGCVDRGYDHAEADISVFGSLAQTTATVTVDARVYSDAACLKQTERVYAKGVATLSADTKTLTTNPSRSLTAPGAWVQKVGRKAQLQVVDYTLAGVSLSGSPTAQPLKFVFVEEGDKLYFSRGSRDADGYSSYLSLIPAVKQP